MGNVLVKSNLRGGDERKAADRGGILDGEFGLVQAGMDCARP